MQPHKLYTNKYLSAVVFMKSELRFRESVTTILNITSNKNTSTLDNLNYEKNTHHRDNSTELICL